MRESFGGVFIIKFLMVFIVFYISFMAIAINYAKVFRIKNQVINIIEQNQYSGNSDINTLDLIEQYLPTVHYFVQEINCESRQNNGQKVEGTNVNGICILPMSDDDNNQYYKVTAYIKIDFPFFGTNLVVPISGETKTIHLVREEREV